MDGFEDEDALIAALYEGVIAPDAWAGAFHLVARGLGAQSFHLLAWERRHARQVYALTTDDLGAEPLREYGEHYGQLDPAVGLLENARPGQLFLTQAMFNERYLDRDEFHQDFLRKWDVRNRVVGCLHREDDLEYHVGILRAPRCGLFETADVARLQALLPHLQGSARLFHRTARLREAATLGMEAFDLLDYGVLTLDRSGCILFANRHAVALMREGDAVGSREGRLRAVRHEDQRRFEAARAEVLQRGYARALAVCRQADPDAGRLFLTIARLPVAQAPLPLVERAELLVLLHDPRARRVLAAPQLMQLFALSVAEARLVEALAHGRTPDEIAAAHGVRITTVRTQLRTAMRKVGCRRQPDLVRLVVGIQAILPERPEDERGASRAGPSRASEARDKADASQ
ncbi:MAG: helix-turn-helix transcriptional regulator [Gammaproteobacteria bacterium]